MGVLQFLLIILGIGVALVVANILTVWLIHPFMLIRKHLGEDVMLVLLVITVICLFIFL